MAQRSGLIGRFQPMMKPNLPHDPDRDTFFGTYFADRPVAPGTNNPLNGGYYGQRFKATCTTCYNPYFYGANGAAKAGCPNCQPINHQGGRFLNTLVNKTRPVGFYYQNGCQVPIYDYHAFAPGPGPDFWPFFPNNPGG
jgi:hypothetical protein